MTINPEYDTASVFAEKLIMTGVWSIYSISDEVKIAEVSIPEEYIGKNLSQIDFDELHNINILGLKQLDKSRSTPSLEKWIAIEIRNFEKDLVLEKDMRFVIKGRKKDIIDFLKL